MEAVLESMRGGWLTTGPRVHEFETSFAAGSGVAHAVAVNSGTAALHLSLAAWGIGPGDEVVMPAFTFVAGAQCARHVGARPVFADIDPKTLCITAETVKRVMTARVKAIMPMQYGGQPLAIADLMEFAGQAGLRVIEDAAHAAGTLDQNGRWAGVMSHAAAYSFYATKNMTCGEGGMFVTNDGDLAERVRVLALHGMDRDAWRRYTQGGKWRYDVVSTGYKYNLSDTAASLGIHQLKRLASMQRRREELARLYISELKDVAGIAPLTLPPPLPAKHSFCIFAVGIDEQAAGVSRDEVIERLNQANIGTSVHFIPTHLFSSFSHAAQAPLPVTDRVWKTIVSLPLYPAMSDEDVMDVTGALRDIVVRAHPADAVSSVPK